MTSQRRGAQMSETLRLLHLFNFGNVHSLWYVLHFTHGLIYCMLKYLPKHRFMIRLYLKLDTKSRFYGDSDTHISEHKYFQFINAENPTWRLIPLEAILQSILFIRSRRISYSQWDICRPTVFQLCNHKFKTPMNELNTTEVHNFL
jgi:hypothetical protein